MWLISALLIKVALKNGTFKATGVYVGAGYRTFSNDKYFLFTLTSFLQLILGYNQLCYIMVGFKNEKHWLCITFDHQW